MHTIVLQAAQATRPAKASHETHYEIKMAQYLISRCAARSTFSGGGETVANPANLNLHVMCHTAFQAS